MNLEELDDWALYERIEVALLSGFCREMTNELMRRYEPHADLERPPAAAVWCLDCEWEKEVEPTWQYPDPVPRARKAAAGHIGSTECEAYDYGRMPV